VEQDYPGQTGPVHYQHCKCQIDHPIGLIDLADWMLMGLDILTFAMGSKPYGKHITTLSEAFPATLRGKRYGRPIGTNVKVRLVWGLGRITMGGLEHYCKYFAIFKPCISTLAHFPILTQPSRLSISNLRSLSALRSDPL